MNHTCDHCGKTADSYWPSGNTDLICKLCFDHYTRDQDDEEDWEDYKTRHPYYVGEELEFDPLQMTKVFLRTVKQECPELLDACKTNAKLLQQRAQEDMVKMEGYINTLEGLLSHIKSLKPESQACQ
jgi:hypothetical protein